MEFYAVVVEINSAEKTFFLFLYNNNTLNPQAVSEVNIFCSSKMPKENLMALIQMKSQEILQHVEEPEQKEAYFFWEIMELLYVHDEIRVVNWSS